MYVFYCLVTIIIFCRRCRRGMAKIIIVLNVKYVILVSTLVNPLEYVVNAQRQTVNPSPHLPDVAKSVLALFAIVPVSEITSQTVCVTIQSHVTHEASGSSVLEHVCNLSYCSYCSKAVKPDHQCFIEVKKSNVKSGKYVFHDLSVLETRRTLKQNDPSTKLIIVLL